MIWIIIIIGVVILYFYNFNNAKKKETIKLNKKGGFSIKYKELIEHFIEIPYIQVEKQSETSITLAVNDSNVVTRFIITHGFEDITVFWSHYSLEFGEHNLNWSCPEYQPQSQIIKLIENDLNHYQKNLLIKHGYEKNISNINNLNMTKDSIQIIQETAKEIQNFLANNKFNKGDLKPDNGYEIPRLLKFNSYIFAYMMAIDQIDNFKSHIKGEFNLQELHLEFINLMYTIFNNIEPTTQELEQLTEFSDHSKHEIWPSAYTSGVETLTEHKGVLRSELESVTHQMKLEYFSVREAFIKKSKGGDGGYVVPYIVYLSFFIYPLMFLEPHDETTYNLKKDFQNKALYFTGSYLKLTEHIQEYIAVKNLKMFKKHQIIG